MDNILYKVSYEVLWNENPDVPKISAFDLFRMIDSGLYAMAKGREGYPILGAQNGCASNLDNHLSIEAYRIELMVWFEEEMNSDLLNE